MEGTPEQFTTIRNREALDKGKRRKVSRVFYGWWIVAISFICLFLSIGIPAYTFGVFLKPLIEEFGWGRGPTSLAHSLQSLVTALAGPVMGKFTDSYGPKKIMLPGAIVAGLSYIILFQITSFWQLCGIFLIIGLGSAGMGLIPANTVVSHWFKKRRGLAIGILMTGIGLGGFIMPPLANYFVSVLGWRKAYMALGIFILTFSLPAISFIKGKPSDMGLLPDGERIGEGIFRQESNPIPEGMTLKIAIKTWAFWSLWIAFLLYSTSFIAVTIHLIPYATDVGIPAGVAALVLGISSGAGIFGRLGYGFIADKLPKKCKHLMISTFLMEAIAILLLIGLSKDSLGMFYLFAILLGVGVGGGASLRPLLTAEYFGLRSFGEILGYLMVAFGLGIALGPVTAGYIFDITGSYYWAFIMYIMAYIISSLALYTAKTPKFGSVLSS